MSTITMSTFCMVRSPIFISINEWLAIIWTGEKIDKTKTYLISVNFQSAWGGPWFLIHTRDCMSLVCRTGMRIFVFFFLLFQSVF